MALAENTRLPVVCLYGPTAAGKTAVAVELVQRLPVEIVSVDSALVYQGMDIGTAKPEPDVLAMAPHRLIDICDPRDSYSVARFCEDALAAIADIHSVGRIPLLVGGTMLYFRALLDGLSPLPPSDPEVRRALENELEQSGLGVLHARLSEIDPVAAARIHPNDPQRVLRALEVFRLAKVPISRLQTRKMDTLHDHFNVLRIGLFPQERSSLHTQIVRRFKVMLEQGFLDEVRELMELEGMNADLSSMRCVGYRQAWGYLTATTSYDEMVEKAVVATRQLAKRQITWIRSTGADELFDPYQQPMEAIAASVEEVIGKYC